MTISFDTLELNLNLVEGLKKKGITEPTDIQLKAIPLALENKDIIGESETGSGKTLAYLLPLFQKIDSSKRELQAIILAPTHELVMQIDREIKLLAEISGVPVTSTTLIGEVNIKRQVEHLKKKPHIVIGSTGRMLELIKMKKMKPHTVKTIVIDEGDKMLDDNNIDGVKAVIKTTLKDRQLMVFSATISGITINTAKNLMKEPDVIKIEEKNIVNPNISHMYFTTEQRDKIITLRKLIASINPERAIVFINKNEEIQLTASKLNYHHIKTYGIYGNASKEERKKALDEFRRGKIQILVASDLAARGLDIKDVTHIFNLDLPENPKEYLHRVGRTGRAGKLGTAISIVTIREKTLIRMFEKKFNIKIEAKEISRGKIVEPGKGKPVTQKNAKYRGTQKTQKKTLNTEKYRKKL